jgi:hypothetical protein
VAESVFEGADLNKTSCAARSAWPSQLGDPMGRPSSRPVNHGAVYFGCFTVRR